MRERGPTTSRFPETISAPYRPIQDERTAGREGAAGIATVSSTEPRALASDDLDRRRLPVIGGARRQTARHGGIAVASLLDGLRWTEVAPAGLETAGRRKPKWLTAHANSLNSPAYQRFPDDQRVNGSPLLSTAPDQRRGDVGETGLRRLHTGRPVYLFP